jgi:catechol 2,3-dioxygenase-like lactoylglutathione lyase family enzyme
MRREKKQMNDILSRIDCNFIPVKNISESIEWYVNKLGCKFMWHDGEYAALNVTLNDPVEGQGNIVLGQAMITLVQVNEVIPLSFLYEDRKHPILNFYAKDILFTHKALKENGVQVSEINDYGQVKGMDFIDNNGHILGVCSF